jgi:hypothetical protein
VHLQIRRCHLQSVPANVSDKEEGHVEPERYLFEE